MSYKKIIKEENASYNCHTITDLVDSFKITDFHDYLKNVLFKKFPVDDEYDVIYDSFTIVRFNEDYLVHVFHGTSVNPINSPEYYIIIDSRHSRIYYIGQSSVGNYISCYNFVGNLLYQEDYGLKKVNLDKFINDYLIEYRCKTIEDLLFNFNLDIHLPNKLLNHEIVSLFGTVFTHYYTQKGEEGTYYVFSGSYDRNVADSFPPTIYIDSLNSVVYFRYNRDGGVAVYKYDSNDIIVQVSMLSFDFWDEYDLEKLLYLGE